MRERIGERKNRRERGTQIRGERETEREMEREKQQKRERKEGAASPFHWPRRGRAKPWPRQALAAARAPRGGAAAAHGHGRPTCYRSRRRGEEGEGGWRIRRRW